MIPLFDFLGLFGQSKGRLLLYARFFFPIEKTKRVILKTCRDARNIAREEIKLVFAR
jgi:hypothetical protein